MNTDQGSQFTGSAWITTLTKAGVRISMDGGGRYLPFRDIASRYPAGQWINIFMERLWRSLKQEAIYLEEINDGFQARRDINQRKLLESVFVIPSDFALSRSELPRRLC